MRFDNLSWISLVQTEKLDAGFRRFVLELIARAEAANPEIKLECGIAPIRYRLMQGAGFGLLAALAISAGFAGTRGSTLVRAGRAGSVDLFRLLALQLLGRNRPAGSRPERCRTGFCLLSLADDQHRATGMTNNAGGEGPHKIRRQGRPMRTANDEVGMAFAGLGHHFVIDPTMTDRGLETRPAGKPSPSASMRNSVSTRSFSVVSNSGATYSR